MSLGIADLQGFVLVKDSWDADGAFILFQGLKLILAPDGTHDAVVVLSKNTAAHLASVLKKTGVNMFHAIDQGRLVVIDVLRLIAPSASPPASKAEGLIDLRQLVAKIVKGAGTLRGNGHPVTVVFEDLTALYSMVGESAEWPIFLRSIAALSSSLSSGLNSSSMIALVHGDIEQDESWNSRLEHLATLVIDIEPLESGLSSEVTGKVTITRRDVPQVQLLADAELGTSQVYYKLAENGATFLVSVSSKTTV